MRRAQQLLCRASKSNASFGAAMGSTRPFSNTTGFRARARTTYNVSSTVLDIDAADNEHIKPLSISRASWLKSAPPIPNRHEDGEWCKPAQLETKPLDMFSEEAAPWINNNPGYYSQFLSTRSSKALEDPQALEQAKGYMRIIDTALERLDRSGTPLSFGFIALGLGMASLVRGVDYELYVQRVGRFLKEVETRGYTFDLRKKSADKFELSLNGQLNGLAQRMVVTRHLASIQILIRPRRLFKETKQTSMRDLVKNRDQYFEWLNMVLLMAMQSYMRRALREEWLLENENGYLAQPSFEAAVALVASFMTLSPVKAAQVVEKWVASEKSSVAEFKRRFNDEFDELMLKLRWDKFRVSMQSAVNALTDEVESKPKVSMDDSALARWEEDVQQKVDAPMPPWMRSGGHARTKSTGRDDPTAAASF